MSHFYGTVSGSRGMATRMGSKTSGLRVNAAGWGGSINVQLQEDYGKDTYTVSLVPWQGSGGQSRVIAEGPLDTNADEFITRGAVLGSRDLDMLQALAACEAIASIDADDGDLALAAVSEIRQIARVAIAEAKK